MPTTQYAHPGERVRLLARGTTSHSVVGLVTTVKPTEITVSVEPMGRALTLPTEAISSVEIEVLEEGTTKWVPGTIPPTISTLFAQFATLFLTGTGAIPRDLPIAGIHKAIKVCAAVDSALFDAEKRELLSQLTSALEEFLRMRSAQDYEKAQRAQEGAINSLAILTASSDPQAGPLRAAASHLKRLIEQYWRGRLRDFDPRPRLVPDSQIPRVSITSSGEAELPLRIRLDPNTAPASKVTFTFDESESIAHLGRAPTIEYLEPGKTHAFRCPIVLQHTLAFERSRIRLRVQMQYSTPSGTTNQAPKQTVEFDLVPDSQFEKVPNPYLAYAGGTTVADPKMFFGRNGLIADIVEQMRSGPLGTGYALYGQKRTGKTSLVEQIRARCATSPVIVTQVSFGILDRSNLTVSFARAILDRIRLALIPHLNGGEYDLLERHWPSFDRIDQRPLESLQSALIAGRSALARKPGWAGMRYVFLFDEFTYLFEVLRSGDYGETAREDIREFMRQWKALLESRVFSSVIVGQDTMPLFMQRFPNEFSSMTPIRLSYLTDSETRNLADRPILRDDGQSRYTGYALESIYEFTAGHPFFTQVLCDRLVQRANERQRSEINELDVSDAFDSLMDGPNRLDPFRFDCLLTADNTGLLTLGTPEDVREELHDPNADYPYRVLSRVAQLSGAGNKYIDEQEILQHEDDDLVIADLLVRDVLERADGIRIKMPLFAEYLRRNA